MSATVAYLDASAAVKLLVPEPETPALRTALAPMAATVSSELLEVELRCVARRRGAPDLLGRVDRLLETIDLLPYAPAVRTRAGEPFAPPQRALDAIHLASALQLSIDGLVVLTYDHEQADAAAAMGLAVGAPA